MKKLFTLLAAVLLTASVLAQSPEKMSYQAVIRNSSDALVINTQVDMQISILQGTADGSPVYVETQTSTTNANGLVSIEIGDGTVVSGDFTTIDWANDAYFIKTETDPAGGTSYTITGTSQLLSVPYALHAKTADNGITTAQADAITANTAKVSYPAADATKLNGIAAGAEVNVQSDWNQGTTTADDYIKNKPTIPAAADGSETIVTAGTNVTVTGSGTTASPYVVNSTAGGSTLAIGQSYQGGIIFWLDATGQYGLIAATTDQSTGIQWYNKTYTWTTAFASAVGAGYGNTRMIVYNQGAGDYAAQLCRDLSLGGYNDWYLPSKYELNLMYQNIGQGNLLGLGNVGAFASAYYWSSTESNNLDAWFQNFTNGTQVSTNKGITYWVRAVRAF